MRATSPFAHVRASVDDARFDELHRNAVAASGPYQSAADGDPTPFPLSVSIADAAAQAAIEATGRPIPTATERQR